MWGWLIAKKSPGREALLRAVPVKNQLVREKRVGEEGAMLGTTVLRLTAPLAPSRLRGIFGHGGRRAHAQKSFDLDALGAFVWQAADGRRTVEEMILHFAETQRVHVREAEVAVLAFLKMLAQRNLVALAVEGSGRKP